MDEEKKVVDRLQESFDSVHAVWKRLQIKTPIGFVWYSIFLWRVKRAKVKLLWEANLDRFYFESLFTQYLEYNDEADRNLLLAEHQKPLDKQDKVKIEELEQKISKAKAIKQQYRRVLDLIAEVESYIQIFQWKRKN